MHKSLIFFVLMIAASIASIVLTPKVSQSGENNNVNLEVLVPKQFGDWKVDEAPIAMMVNPETKLFIDKIYSQTLSRTYVNAEGRRIMISLAYGADQRHENQIHKPEVCYPAQGFQIVNKFKDKLVLSDGRAIPVMRIQAVQGRRTEPITYWIRVGDTVVRGAIEQNLARIKFGLNGGIPDGLLFRVSEINQDVDSSYSVQNKFIDDLLNNISAGDRYKFVGRDD